MNNPTLAVSTQIRFLTHIRPLMEKLLPPLPGWGRAVLVGLALLIWLPQAGRGQSALDGFDPNAADGLVTAIAVEADGKILVGGGFGSIGGQTRNDIARLNADGTLDSAFINTNANDLVNAIAVQPDGKILVAGAFTNIGGQSRNFIARLNPDGTLDGAFNPNANSSIAAIAVQSDGKILVGGQFTSIGGQTRNNIARLNADGTLDSAFNPGANSFVLTITVQSNAKILVGGSFTSLGGQTRNYIGRLNPDGTLDGAFDPNANFWVRAIAAQVDGKILVGGQFSSINGFGRNNIARLNTDGTLDNTFSCDANNEVSAIVVQPDGKILVSGFFTSIAGQPPQPPQTHNRIARLIPMARLTAVLIRTQTMSSWHWLCSRTARLSWAEILRALADRHATTSRGSMPMVTLDASSNPNADAFVRATAVQPDGKILVGGGFSNIGGQPRCLVARLNGDGTTDNAFISCAGDGTAWVSAIAAPTGGGILGGWILVGGLFINLQLLSPIDGSLATSVDVDAEVRAVAVQSDGKVIVGGSFISIGGQTRNGIARFNADGGFDSFNPNANAAVNTIAMQADGKILVGGEFTSIGGQTSNFIARLNVDGLWTALLIQS